MEASVEELTIAAAPEGVWGALTQPDEIGHWWTTDLNAKPEVGSLAEFRFGEWGDSVFRFEVAELDAGKKVHRCPVVDRRGVPGEPRPRPFRPRAVPREPMGLSFRAGGREESSLDYK